MKFLILVILVFVTLFSNAQVSTLSYQDNYSYSHVKYTYGPYYFNETMGLVKGLLKEKQLKEKRAEYKLLMQTKTKELKDYYLSLKDHYPKTIKDGWHEVVLISGDRYIDERKVYVQNNKIEKVVWDNWLPDAISFGGLVVNGKSAISFKNTRGNENLGGLVEVYFMNAIANHSGISTPPLKPAKLVFWTRKNGYKKWKIRVDDNTFGPFKIKHKKGDEINCEDYNELILFVKPGYIEYGRASYYSGKLI